MNPLRLNLGCGRDLRAGYINVDKSPELGVDLRHDLEDLPLPFEDATVEEILCIDILEHLENYADLLIKTGRAGEAKRAQTLAVSIRDTVARANQAAPAEPGKKAKPAVKRLVVPG